MKTPHAQLSDLLRAMFDTHELRSFLMRLDRGKELVDALAEGYGIALLAEDAVDILRRRGRITAELFEVLLAHAPERRDDIAATSCAWSARPPPRWPASASAGLPPTSRHATTTTEPVLLVLRCKGAGRGAYIRDKLRLRLQDADFDILRRMAEGRGEMVPYSKLTHRSYAQKAVSEIRTALRAVPPPFRADAKSIAVAIRTERKHGYGLALSKGELRVRDDEEDGSHAPARCGSR